MSEPPTQPSAPFGTIPPPNATPSRKGLGLGCQILLWGGLVVLLVGGVFVVSAIRAKNWFGQKAEATAAEGAAPVLSTEEEQGLEKFFWQYWKAYKEKSDLEVAFTPNQFNAFVMREMAKKKKAGTAKSQDPEAFQAAFEGEAFVVRFAVPDQAGKFRNFEARGFFSIENRRVAWSLDEIKLGGKEAPWLARFLLRRAFQAVVEAYEHPPADAPASPLEGFKLLRREGERIHLIADGNYLPPPEERH